MGTVEWGVVGIVAVVALVVLGRKVLAKHYYTFHCHRHDAATLRLTVGVGRATRIKVIQALFPKMERLPAGIRKNITVILGNDASKANAALETLSRKLHRRGVALDLLAKLLGRPRRS